MRFEFQHHYLGESGDTQNCLIAVDAILGSGAFPESVTIVTHVKDKMSTPRQEEHLLLFWHWPSNWSVTTVPSGFASGYPGQGPRGFSLAICLIRSKSIPIQQIYVNQIEFRHIDSGKLNQQILENIKIHSEPMVFPFPAWVLSTHEQLLEKDQLWRVCNWRESRPDWLSFCMARVDEFHPGVGEKLRLALRQLASAESSEQYQQIGILLRDSWIEFAQKLTEGLDISGIGPNDAKKLLRQLKLSEQVNRTAESAFDLGLKVQHDRKASEGVTKACLINSATSMDMILELVLGDENTPQS